MNNRGYKIMTICALALAVIAIAAAAWSTVRAQQSLAAVSIPPTLNYQGILRDDQGRLINGDFTIRARIYANPQLVEGEPVKYETTLQAVPVRDGLFNIVLGDNPALDPKVFQTTPLYVGISLNGQADMIPRQRLHAVPWAFTASTLITDAQIQGFTSSGPITVNSDATVGSAAINGNLVVDGKISQWDGKAGASKNYGPIIHFVMPAVELMTRLGDRTEPHTPTCDIPTDWISIDIRAKYLEQKGEPLPADVQAVILEGQGAMSIPDGPIPWDRAATIVVRPFNSTPTDFGGFTLIRGSAPMSNDAIVVTGNGIFPVDPATGKIEYMVGIQNGFNFGCYIYLNGYIR